MKPINICLECPEQPLNVLENSLKCSNCGKAYLKDSLLGIYDFTPKDLKKEAETFIDFKALYERAEDLETRVRFFSTRFTHDLRLDDFFNNINRSKRNILEIGCGTMEPLLKVGNKYSPKQNVYGLDLSKALLSKALINSPNTHLFIADAQKIPFSKNSFHMIWARHMLYHTDSPRDAVAECARVLDERGILVASTNSINNKEAMHSFHKSLSNVLGIQGKMPTRASERFSRENGELIFKPYFKNTIAVNYEGKFTFKKNEFLEYYFSTAYFKWLVERVNNRIEEVKDLAQGLFDKEPVIELKNPGGIIFGTHGDDEFNVILIYLKSFFQVKRA